ncbi:putative Cytochrome P450 2U1 [Hypsibius exemplaris]|uniref:Cytochrome P450 2U1 n=1 Tax=Hypsibius exemplaris TaxID=2072580 RepID=A0A1W0WL19_HYPEX|nr:putative Cytochrome P450 2U1 [Hypsibius exemplaris]
MCSVSNVVCMLCFGKRYEHDDPEFVQMLENVQDASVYPRKPARCNPTNLAVLPAALERLGKALVRIGENNTAAMKANVQEHRRSYDPNETKRLHRRRSSQAEGGVRVSSGNECGISWNYYWLRNCRRGAYANLIAFFGAGTETTTMTMYWSLLFMLHHPEVQAKIHAELDDKIGAGKLQSCLIWKLSVGKLKRLANVSPFGVMRANTEETTLMGYRIPKRCFIMPNFKSVNIDPKLWTDPLTFNPNRFLDEQGKSIRTGSFHAVLHR